MPLPAEDCASRGYRLILIHSESPGERVGGTVGD